MDKELLKRLLKGGFIQVNKCPYSREETYEVKGRDIGKTMEVSKEEHKYLKELKHDNT